MHEELIVLESMEACEGFMRSLKNEVKYAFTGKYADDDYVHDQLEKGYEKRRKRQEKVAKFKDKMNSVIPKPEKAPTSRGIAYDLDGELEANDFTEEDLIGYNKRIGSEVNAVITAIKAVVTKYKSKYKDDCEFVFHAPKNGLSKGYNIKTDTYYASCYPMGYEPVWSKGKDGYGSDIANKAIDDCMEEIENICKRSKLKIEIYPCKDNTDTPYYTKTRFFIWLYMEEK